MCFSRWKGNQESQLHSEKATCIYQDSNTDLNSPVSFSNATVELKLCFIILINKYHCKYDHITLTFYFKETPIDAVPSILWVLFHVLYKY